MEHREHWEYAQMLSSCRWVCCMVVEPELGLMWATETFLWRGGGEKAEEDGGKGVTDGVA
jgi:hypothetical protein